MKKILVTPALILLTFTARAAAALAAGPWHSGCLQEYMDQGALIGDWLQSHTESSSEKVNVWVHFTDGATARKNRLSV